MVSTVMANLGLERALSALGIGVVRVAVGDRYVLEEMRRLVTFAASNRGT